MLLQPILINGRWETPDGPASTFQAVNPAEKSELPAVYPVSSGEDVDRAVEAACGAAARLLAMPPDRLADFLEKFAENIEARASDLVDLANQETALPKEPRLASVELPRTTNQLRQAAAAARDRSWSYANIDIATNIRSVYRPLGGAVAIFAPNNFPFAFNSAAGGDFAAAIAVGNPVIAMANPGHPGTSKIFAEAALEAVKATGLPKATVQMMYLLNPSDGFKMVSHSLIGATGFTGSKSAGIKLKEAADQAGKPIYLEMSSVNPVFVLPGALRERSYELAEELSGSCSMGAGQFCTNPGLVVLEAGEDSETFLRQVSEQFSCKGPQTLLGKNGPRNIAGAVQVLIDHGAEVVEGGQVADGPGYAFKNTVLRVSGDAFVADPDALQMEAFGTVTLAVFAKDTDEMKAVARNIEGNLTGSFYTHTDGDDDEVYNQVEPILRQKVGRLLNDKMPTGVAVVPSMNHGGPYPATGHPGFTAVGIPAALLRFTALHCYDNVRSHRLPKELQDRNPTGAMWRLIDGEWSQGDV
jgi:NADP-dependent aldehyde dehydrogenase